MVFTRKSAPNTTTALFSDLKEESVQRAGWVLAGGAPHLGLIKDSSQLAPRRSTCQGREFGWIKRKRVPRFYNKGWHVQLQRFHQGWTCKGEYCSGKFWAPWKTRLLELVTPKTGTQGCLCADTSPSLGLTGSECGRVIQFLRPPFYHLWNS